MGWSGKEGAGSVVHLMNERGDREIFSGERGKRWEERGWCGGVCPGSPGGGSVTRDERGDGEICSGEQGGRWEEGGWCGGVGPGSPGGGSRVGFYAGAEEQDRDQREGQGGREGGKGGEKLVAEMVAGLRSPG